MAAKRRREPFFDFRNRHVSISPLRSLRREENDGACVKWNNSGYSVGELGRNHWWCWRPAESWTNSGFGYRPSLAVSGLFVDVPSSYTISNRSIWKVPLTLGRFMYCTRDSTRILRACHPCRVVLCHSRPSVNSNCSAVMGNYSARMSRSFFSWIVLKWMTWCCRWCFKSTFRVSKIFVKSRGPFFLHRLLIMSYSHLQCTSCLL